MPSDFGVEWEKILDKYGLRRNSWLEKLYSIREKWIPAYALDARYNKEREKTFKTLNSKPILKTLYPTEEEASKREKNEAIHGVHDSSDGPVLKDAAEEALIGPRRHLHQSISDGDFRAIVQFPVSRRSHGPRGVDDGEWQETFKSCGLREKNEEIHGVHDSSDGAVLKDAAEEALVRGDSEI
nr:protein FAR1-RELATED SEQUENCE 5-like [Ipomoea batatas]GME18300.1 protein FAR1-RELATED SEQUENCE 5-like [Ipomoea batatas]